MPKRCNRLATYLSWLRTCDSWRALPSCAILCARPKASANAAESWYTCQNCLPAGHHHKEMGAVQDRITNLKRTFSWTAALQAACGLLVTVLPILPQKICSRCLSSGRHVIFAVIAASSSPSEAGRSISRLTNLRNPNCWWCEAIL